MMNIIFRMSCMAVAVGLAGCGANQSGETTQNVVEQVNQQYVSPLPDSAPVVKVATTGTMPPFSYQDEYGNMMGIDIEVIRAIGEEEGFKVEFYQDTWANLFPSVVAGQRDLAISGISYNDERNGRYGLSDSYLINPSAVMYKDVNMQVNGLPSLRGKRVAAMTGSKQEEQMQAVGGYSELISEPSTFLLFEALMQGRADAVLQDEPLLRYTAANYREYQLKITPYEDPNAPGSQQVVLLAKQNTELLNKVNSGIAKLKSSGKLKAIEDKYLGTNK